MPMYDYRYEDTDELFTEFQQMSEEPLTEHKGRACRRVVSEFRPITRYGKGNGCDPIQMMSIAVDSREEIDAFRQRNPGVEISDVVGDPLFGIPVAKSKSEKNKILAAEGFVDKKSYC